MLRRLEDLVDPFQSHNVHTPRSTTAQFILDQLRPFRRVVAFSLALSAVSAVIEVWLIFYAGQLVDALAETSRDRFWAEHGTELLIVAAAILIARPLAWLGRESLDDIAFRPNAVMFTRWRAHRHVIGQSVGWFQSELSGRIAMRVMEIGNSAAGAAYTVLHTLSFVTIYILGSIWLMASVDIRLVIPLFVWAGLYLALMAYAVPRFRDASETFQESQSALSGLLVDTYANIDTLKLFANGAGDDDREDRKRFAATRAAYIKLQRFEVRINVGMMALSTLLMVLLVGYSIVLWQRGDAPIGIIAASLALNFRISGMAEWLLDAVASLFGYIGATRESLKTIAQPHDITDRPEANELSVHGGSIQLSNVSHHYGKGDGGLDDVSLVIATGEKVGLVGPSGAGKSTLVNLILRFFDTETGRIEIDGQEIRDVTQDSLRRQIAMVAQNHTLLNRSVRDNITLGRHDVSDDDVEEAARQAAADSFIPGLQDSWGRTGFDAYLGERGVKLSGGQRQRIALARAILKNAPVLVLDEATSALDSEVEAEIQDTLYRVMQGKTVIAIAHRLSTIAQMDRIVVLENGRIVEEGQHDSLLELGGVYARLWNRQSGGFIGT
jgi:ATP-binding cassette, subfamily B, multidrug efflux pump